MLKKITLFVVWMMALSLFVYKMAYASCSMGEGGKSACPMMSGQCHSGDGSSWKRCQKGNPKFNFVPANKKAK